MTIRLVLQWLAFLLSDEPQGVGGGRRLEGSHHGGFSLEFLPVWKSREVFFCLPHNFHLCFRDDDPS